MQRTVVIAGGGPTGLMLAGELALAGVRPVVIERRPEPAAASQGMTLHGRSVELLAQRGLAERIREEDRFLWPRTPFSMLWLDLKTVDEVDHTFIHHQWRTERLLEGRAAELGVEIRRGHEVVAFEQDADGVTVTVRSAAGDEDTIRAGYLVACDGGKSVVRRLAGIAFEGNSPGFYGVLGDVPVAEAGDHLFDAGVYPAGLFGAMPIDPAFLRLMTVEIDAQPPPAGTPVTVDELRDSIERVIGKTPAIGQTLWLHRFDGATRLAERYRDGRVFLAGDAAHTLFFSGTAGLNAGLQDAVNLGWKLAAALQGWAPDHLLDSYHEERHPIGVQLCDHADAVLALMHPLQNVAELREIVAELLQFEEVSRYLLRLPTATRYPMDYPGRPADKEAHPLLGTHVPDAPLVTSAGPGSVARTLHAGRAVLLDLSGGALPHGAVGGWADRLDVVVADPSGDLAATCVLIRPDGYVAFAADGDVDTDGLRLALDRWLGAPTPLPV
jgi:2-polyprenyl-6-methoxyphenol hydroxylase-like FAD-dependent oxidoreductase